MFCCRCFMITRGGNMLIRIDPSTNLLLSFYSFSFSLSLGAWHTKLPGVWSGCSVLGWVNPSTNLLLNFWFCLWEPHAQSQSGWISWPCLWEPRSQSQSGRISWPWRSDNIDKQSRKKGACTPCSPLQGELREVWRTSKPWLIRRIGDHRFFI